MSVKILSSYMNLCRGLNMEPSWKGLRAFHEFISLQRKEVLISK
jgi:hypothetical protein